MVSLKYKKKNLRREAKSELRTVIYIPYEGVVRITQVPRALRHLVSLRVLTRYITPLPLPPRRRGSYMPLA